MTLEFDNTVRCLHFDIHGETHTNDGVDLLHLNAMLASLDNVRNARIATPREGDTHRVWMSLCFLAYPSDQRFCAPSHHHSLLRRDFDGVSRIGSFGYLAKVVRSDTWPKSEATLSLISRSHCLSLGIRYSHRD